MCLGGDRGCAGLHACPGWAVALPSVAWVWPCAGCEGLCGVWGRGGVGEYGPGVFVHVHICTCIWVSVFVHFMLARERALIRAYAGVCTRVLALLTLLAVSLESGLGGWTQAAMVGKLAGWLDLQGDELQAALGPAGRAREEGTGVWRS